MKKNLASKEIAIASVFCAIITVVRIVAYIFPGRPIIGLLIITSMYLGSCNGAMIGIVSFLISNCFLNHGLWTPFQLLAAILIGFSSGFLKDKKWGKNKIVLTLWTTFCVILYSIIMIFYHLASTGSKLPALIIWYFTSGILKDAGALILNVAIVLFLTNPVGKILKGSKKYF